jgi:holo-[acyl-carrier protein] synthase
VATPPHVGIDLIEPDRLTERLRSNESLGATLFTERERRYCEAQSRPEEHLAARFCAKEAVIKALGIDGWDPLEVEIVGGGSDVWVQLHGDVATVASELKVTVTVSMTHLVSLAGAIALVRPVE